MHTAYRLPVLPEHPTPVTQGLVSSSLSPLQLLSEHPVSQCSRRAGGPIPDRGCPHPCRTFLPGPDPTGGVSLEGSFGRGAERGTLAAARMERDAGDSMEPELTVVPAKAGKRGEKPQKHIPNRAEGSWRGAVTRAPVLHLPSLYFLSSKVAQHGSGSESRSIRYKESLSAAVHLCVTSARLRSQALITLHLAAVRCPGGLEPRGEHRWTPCPDPN